MNRKPLYHAEDIPSPAYQLRYGWTGWPREGHSIPSIDEESWLTLDQNLEKDGIRRLVTTQSQDKIQIVASVRPEVSPVRFVARLKGRLQHSIGKAQNAFHFSRKVGFRTIGNNSRQTVENYIASQVERAVPRDPFRYELLKQFTIENPSVHLQEPTITNSGRYWYNLHLVLVTADRDFCLDMNSMSVITDQCRAIALKKSYQIRIQSLQPEHLHLALRGNIDHSPQEIALAFLNNLAFAIGQKLIWRPGYYVGTFGEYDMDAVRYG